MWVLMEVEETGCMDLGTKRDMNGNQYVQAQANYFYKSPPDVLVAAVKLLQTEGYSPRYSRPADS
ncbi:unnamed protein product, partial [marine sediment metagenome]